MRYKVLLEKAVAACISAIEVYNKPDFKYREETFSILMINAWELLLKAKVLKDNPKNQKILFATRPKRLKDGRLSETLTEIKKTRSGNPMTIDLSRALELVAANGANGVNEAFKENIHALCEIRDSSIHSYSADKELCKAVLELGTASLRNFINANKKWFKNDLSKYNFFLMPISFFSDIGEVAVVTTSTRPPQVNNFLNYLGEQAQGNPSNAQRDFNLLLRIETKFIKSKAEADLTARIVRTPAEAPDPAQVMTVQLTEEQWRASYPYTHKDLVDQLRTRYSDFKQDQRFNGLMKAHIKPYERHCKKRQLNPANPKSAKQEFYSSGCLQVFDDHYTRNA